MLIAFGEFLRNNHVLLPAGWCEEWWVQTIENSPSYSEEEALKDGVDVKTLETEEITVERAFELSKRYNVPLHPRYTYFYHEPCRTGTDAQEKTGNALP